MFLDFDPDASTLELAHDLPLNVPVKDVSTHDDRLAAVAEDGEVFSGAATATTVELLYRFPSGELVDIDLRKVLLLNEDRVLLAARGIVYEGRWPVPPRNQILVEDETGSPTGSASRGFQVLDGTIFHGTQSAGIQTLLLEEQRAPALRHRSLLPDGILPPRCNLTCDFLAPSQDSSSYAVLPEDIFMVGIP